MDISQLPADLTSGWKSEAISGLFGGQQDAGMGNAAFGVMRMNWGDLT
jgi:hypothetical protein